MEYDLLGELAAPDDAHYGVHTTGALRNFAVSGIPVGHHPDLVNALAAVKQAAAAAIRDLGRLTDADAAAILRACAQIRGGALHDQFVVDVIQGGAGTSTNMNANEVIANRALELLGHRRGDCARLHPLDQVNAGQSTNDVYPTAARSAVWTAAEPLLTQLGHLRQGITASEAALRETAANSAGLATALSPTSATPRPASWLGTPRPATGRCASWRRNAACCPRGHRRAARRPPGSPAPGLQDATATRPPAGLPATITGGTA
jgi:fumarate hydratase class II